MSVARDRVLTHELEPGSPPPTTSNSHLRSRLTEIEQQIVRLESQLARLRVEREGIVEKLDSIVYPILTVPPEVTSEIFIHSVGRPNYSPSRGPKYDGPLRLASICRAWRAIALSTPRIWTHFHAWSPAIIHRPTENVSDLLGCWLPRAGSLPLDVVIQLPAVCSYYAILSTLAQYSSQWLVLRLMSGKPFSFPIGTICTPLSCLKRIEISIQYWPDAGPTCITEFLDALHLSEAFLSGVTFPRISLPWIQLTDLELHHTSLAECLNTLEQTPNLESLTYSTHTAAVPAVFPLLTMPRFHTLKLRSSLDFALLDHLTVPVPASLHLHSLSAAAATQLELLVERSGCSVRALRLIGTWFAGTHACISTLHFLTDVTIESPHWSTDNFSEFFEWLVESSEMLNRLESLAIDRCYVTLYISGLSRILSNRCGSVVGAAKLKSFQLSFGNRVRQEFDNALQKFLELRVQGLNIDVLPGPDDYASRTISITS
ncbi:hypothetical protein FB451DRAFT_1103074 [Mycena latifolia]|nr:hypothetical protein FB451DRAFT_1103074 [Mycena latifolia]